MPQLMCSVAQKKIAPSVAEPEAPDPDAKVRI